MPRHFTADHQGGAHVEVEHGIEVLVVGVGEQRRAVHAGTVDEDLERAKCRDGARHRGRVGDIQHQRLHLPTALAQGATLPVSSQPW